MYNACAEGDGAVAAGQAVSRRRPSLKTCLTPVSAPAASTGDEARAPAVPAPKMYAWQHVNQVRKDLSEMRRPRSTQDEIGSVVSFLAAPSDPAVAPAGPSSQRGPSSSQRGSSPKFTPATALVVSNVRRDDTAHTPGAPKGNAATAASISGRPHQGPLLEALAVGTDLWETSIPCNLVRVRDPANARTIVLSKSPRFPDVVVWNPWADRAKVHVPDFTFSLLKESPRFLVAVVLRRQPAAPRRCEPYGRGRRMGGGSLAWSEHSCETVWVWTRWHPRLSTPSVV